jgi:hypothetical protein
VEFGPAWYFPRVPKDTEYSEEEAAARRDATIKRMIAMPPKPYSEMKIGKTKKKQARKKRTKAKSY